jgi:heme o synthase
MSGKSTTLTTEVPLLADPLAEEIASNKIEERIEKAEEVSKSAFAAYLELSKPRILVLILLISMAGFCLASRGNIDKLLLLNMVIGIGFLAAGTGSLNQFLERDSDGLMRRTDRRPLPSGRLTPLQAGLFGVITSVVGIAYLALTVNLLTAILGISTLVSYVFLYTPLKQRTPQSTFIGAFPGAMPPLMGWTSVHGSVGIEATVLFLIMFLWQFPHFLAIAWMYREDYSRAGIRMLPIVEPDGKSTGRQILFYALILVPISLAPTLIGLTGWIYFGGALLLSLVYLYYGFRMAVLKTGIQAKRLLQISILYLPLLFILMLMDKIVK